MKRLIAAIAVLLALVILPQMVGKYYVNLLTNMLIFAIFSMSLDLLVGYLHLPSLGHAAFFGVAAYTIGIFSTKVLNSFWINFPLAIMMAGAVAAIFGLLALRTRAGYFFMITLALSEVLWGIAFRWRSFTRGDDGIPSISRPDLGFIPWSLWDATNYFYFVLFFFVVAFILMYIIVKSPFGRIILGIRENELRMRALGFNTWFYKYICFIIAALFAGLSGVLSVYLNGFVSPAALSVHMSAEALLPVLLGGAGTLFGPAIGAGTVVLLDNIVSSYTERRLLFLGIMYLIVVMFTPQGILGLINKMRLKRRVKP
jgi:branched-chain amino acid transport system permease protein